MCPRCELLGPRPLLTHAILTHHPTLAAHALRIASPLSQLASTFVAPTRGTTSSQTRSSPYLRDVEDAIRVAARRRCAQLAPGDRHLLQHLLAHPSTCAVLLLPAGVARAVTAALDGFVTEPSATVEGKTCLGTAGQSLAADPTLGAACALITVRLGAGTDSSPASTAASQGGYAVSFKDVLDAVDAWATYSGRPRSGGRGDEWGTRSALGEALAAAEARLCGGGGHNRVASTVGASDSRSRRRLVRHPRPRPRPATQIASAGWRPSAAWSPQPSARHLEWLRASERWRS